jgi:DNA-binding NtrC family response regulator
MERVGSSRTQRVDVRVISATNANPEQEVAENRLRQDLLFRLNTIEIHLPPLRERREDIPLLAAYFLAMHARRYRKALAGFEPAAMRLLRENAWRGNVRELNHVVERAVLMAQEAMIRAGDVAVRPAREGAGRLEEMSLEEVEGFLIRKALARHAGNVSHAARALGLSRSALYRRLERHGL